MSVLGELVELVLPLRCPGCGAAGDGLCTDCADARFPPILRTVHGLTVSASGVYGGGLRSALITYKERNRRQLATPLGRLLARALAGVPLTGCGAVLVPMPSTRSVARARGGDHVARLAAVAARESGLPMASALRLRRSVRDSAGLDGADRRANLDGAMQSVPPAGRQLTRVAIVLDDIVTTGATVLEATRALRLAGWAVAGAATVAATPRREHRPDARPGRGSPGVVLRW